MVKGRLIGIEIQQKILTLKEEGCSIGEIVQRCEVSQSSVYRIINKGQIQNNRVYLKGTGRPTSLSARDKRHIRRKLKSDPTTSAKKKHFKTSFRSRDTPKQLCQKFWRRVYKTILTNSWLRYDDIKLTVKKIKKN